MAVMVDKLVVHEPNYEWPYAEVCSLFADTTGELHVHAESMGLQRAWFIADKAFPHYVLTSPKRRQAVQLGALQVSDEVVKRIKARNR